MNASTRAVGMCLGLVALAGCSGESVLFEPEPITTSGRFSRQLIVDGFVRTFGVYIPDGVSPTTPSPVMLIFHGVPKSVGMEAITGMNSLADELGFVAVYPSAYRNEDWAHGCPTCTGASQKGVDDVAYVRGVLDKLAADISVDERRVYATGFSQGGMMMYRLACDLADRITAFAPVGTGMWDWHRDRCEPARPFPLLTILGTEDISFPWVGLQREGNVSLLSADETRDFWLDRNGCPATGAETALPDTVDDGTAVFRIDYVGCTGGEATFYRIEGGGHTWPKGPIQFDPSLGRQTQELDGSRTVAEFLMRQRR